MTTQKLDTTADVIAIDQLWARYAFELDRRNFGGVADLFTADGGYEILQRDVGDSRCDAVLNGGAPVGARGHANIVTFLTATYDQHLNNHDAKPWTAASYHTVTNTLINVDGDSATMHAYLVGGGTYESTFVRTDAGWKAKRNRVIFDDPTITEGWPALLDAPHSDASASGTAVHVATESVADIVAIGQLSSRSAYELDRCNFDGVADLFTSSGGYEIYHRNVDTGGSEPATNAGAAVGAKGHDNIVAFLREAYRQKFGVCGLTPWPRPPYSPVTNELIDVAGDAASMHAYLVGGGTYDSTFVRTDAGWKTDCTRVTFDDPTITAGWPALLEAPRPAVPAGPGSAISFTDEESRDIVEINQLWTRYAFELDKRNFLGVADLFTEDGGYEVYYRNLEEGQYEAANNGADCVSKGHDNIVAFLAELWTLGSGECEEKPWPVPPYHSITNRMIEIDGDEARLHSYLVGNGTYDNTFRRTSRGWKVVRNRIVLDDPGFWIMCIDAATLASGR